MAIPQDEDLGLSDVWAILYEHKKLIGLVTFLATAIATVAAFLMTPIFRAEVLLAPAAEQQSSLGSLAAQFGGLAELGGVNLSQGTSKATAIATLRSRSLTEEFIRDLNLMPILFEDDWDAEANRWNEQDPKRQPSLWDACVTFDTSIRNVQEDRKTGLITLTVDWSDPVRAADWANELVRRTNAKLQRDAIEEGQKTIAFLEQQLGKASVLEVRQALFSLIESETKRIAVAHAREGFAFKVIDPAVVPRKKFKPQRKIIVVIGFALGLVVSSLGAVLSASALGRRPPR